MHPLLTTDATLLLLGNEAVVRGALEAGIGAFATYPGTPASEIGDAFAALSAEAGVFFEYAVNEKVAVETVIAFSLSGWRAMAAMKHVGLNVAADAFMTFPYLGVDGGAVIVSADDPGCHSSQNEQDNRHFARMAKTPMLEPANPTEARDLTRAAFEWSERLGLPVLLRMTTRVSHMRAPVTLRPLPSRPVAARLFRRDPFNRVLVPAVARRRHEELLRRLREAARAADLEAFHSARVPPQADLGVLATGAARNLVRDALRATGLDRTVALLEPTWTWPHPEATIISFLRPLKRVLVVEEGTPFQEDAVAAIAHRARLQVEVLGKGSGHFRENGEMDPDAVTAAIVEVASSRLSTSRPRQVETSPALSVGEVSQSLALPSRPPILCPGCPHRASFLMARQVVGPETIVATDIGCYTLGLNPPLDMGDLLVCMGSSISTGAALSEAQDRPVLAVIGDSTFFHAGVPALIHAVAQSRRFMLLVLDNRTTAMTGFQPHPGALYDTSRLHRDRPDATSPHALPDERVSIEALARACGVAVVETADPYRPAEALKALRRAFGAHGVSVVVMRSPCPQMAERARALPRRPPVRILRDRCRTCGNSEADRHCALPEVREYQGIRATSRLALAPVADRPPVEPLATPPCTTACPAQVCVQGYVALTAAGRFREAYEHVRRRIPFPAVCAFVCPHPCEQACVHGVPIAIRHLKRMVVRFGYHPGVVQPGPDSKYRVAVVGAGPSGLTAAEYLRRFGHAVTLFEASDTPGGLLVHAIPRFRLPADVVRREIGDVLALGVDLRTGVTVGREIGVEDLLGQGYGAVVLAVGLADSLGLDVPGSDLLNVVDALVFLREAAWGRTGRLDGDVIVIGGGNTAMDAARTALRLGAREAVVVYRRSSDEMPAFREEVDLARREGVRFVFQATPVRFEGDGARVSKAVFQRTRLAEPDESGRRRPVPIEGSEFTLPVTLVLLALGQKPQHPSTLGLRGVEGKGLWAVSRDTLMLERPGVFVCGDASGGPATVIHAIHQGEAVASSVDRYLRTGTAGIALGLVASAESDASQWRRVAEGVAEVPLSPDPYAWEGRDALEGITPERLMSEARAEALRCLQCGTCANCRACVDLTGCPALRWRPAHDGQRAGPEVIESLCNGCGLCAALCPNGAIVCHDH